VVTVPVALDRHRGHRRAWYGDIIGPLLVRASQATDLLAATRPGDDLVVGLIADTGLAGLVAAMHVLNDQEDRVSAATVEIALPVGYPPGPATRTLVDELALTATAYVEVPRVGFEDALDVLAADGVERAKYRTGGVRPDAFPDEGELGTFLAACARRRVAFKLTAGLHHALRGTSPDGFEQHGFLNIFAATAAALRGDSPADLAAVLALRRPDPVLELLAGLSEYEAAAVRRLFGSFGCCGVIDPVHDLVELGALVPEAG